MKHYLLILLLLTGFGVYAQNSPPRGSSYQDSIRSKSSSDKVTMVDGTPMTSAKDFVENLTPASNYSLFSGAIRAAGMIGTLKSRGPLTVFVPADSAFSKLSTKLDTLMQPAHKYELINILSYHAVAGNYTDDDLAKLINDGDGEASLLTLSGSKLKARIDGNRNIVLYDETGGQSIISRFNIEQSNGTMHIITQVLIPKNRAM